MKARVRIALALSACLITVVPSAGAVGTRTFELDSLEDLSGGELRGTSVDSLGRVTAGWNLGALPLGDASTIWSSLAIADGVTLLGTGNTGVIFRASAGQVLPYAQTGQLAVTSLVRGFQGDVYAATLPKGRIVRLGASGATALFAELPAQHVWALAYDAAKKALYAATGPDGKVFRIDERGKVDVYFDSEEPHLVSLAISPDGTLYAGSSGQALLYRITGPGRATVLYDMPGEEARAIALATDGSVYAIANEYGELPELQKRAAGGQSPAGPVAANRPKPGKGTLFRIDREGRPEKLLHRDDTHFVSLAVGHDGRAYVGTGSEGRVYAVDEAHTSTLVADTDERQVSVLVLDAAKPYIATSDPPVFHSIRGSGGQDAVWTSKVLDAGLPARFGRLSFEASGRVELSVRAGNTKTPDATWSEWGAPTSTSGSPSRLGLARFVQVRARFATDPGAVLSRVTIPFLTENVRAVVTEVLAQPRNVPPTVRDSQLAPPSGGEPPSHSSMVKLTWKVDNPDADSLRYRLSFRKEEQPRWYALTRPDEPLNKTEFEWDTASLAEGHYRVRVEATDEAANPPERVRRHSLESSVFVVDNTPPVFRSLTLTGRRLQAVASDGVGPIARVDVLVDGRPDWHPLLPVDGIFDEAEEHIDADLSLLVAPGPHLLAVRAFDQAGNFAVRSIELP